MPGIVKGPGGREARMPGRASLKGKKLGGDLLGGAFQAEEMISVEALRLEHQEREAWGHR